MTTDFIHGRPMKQIVLFSLPIMLSSLLQYTYNMVDNIIVGRYVSTNALAAVGNIAPISSFAIGAAFGLTAGFTIPVAQCFGAGDQEETNRQAGNGIGLSLITGVLFSALALLVLHPMLGWIHTPKEIYDLSVQYAAIMYLGVPAQLLYNVFTGIARSVGDSKKPLLFLLISVAVNLVLDLLFVAHFGWGVAGAAWATLISQIVAAVSAGIYVFRGIPVLQLKARMLVPTAKRTRRQLALGIPVSLQFTITSIGSKCRERLWRRCGGGFYCRRSGGEHYQYSYEQSGGGRVYLCGPELWRRAVSANSHHRAQGVCGGSGVVYSLLPGTLFRRRADRGSVYDGL